ncbi:hypothetical protein Q7P37_000541 [Cladosporium fusiforme]
MSSTHSAFFYGTLMAPSVLHRVCHGSTSPSNPIYATHNLKTTPALLPSHRRHRVKRADYPAILPHATSSVRGTYVTGLTASDMWRLDIFEGPEYERVRVKCRVLNSGGEEGEEVEAEAYLWIGGEEQLEEREWDFDEFQREKMRFWVGEGADGEYADVDEAVAGQKQDGTGGRGLNGNISSALAEEHKKDEVVKSAV